MSVPSVQTAVWFPDLFHNKQSHVTKLLPELRMNIPTVGRRDPVPAVGLHRADPPHKKGAGHFNDHWKQLIVIHEVSSSKK